MGCDGMFQKNTKEILETNRQIIILRDKYKRLRNPFEAIQLLQQTLELVRHLDKHQREELILNLRQIATDLQFRHYRARCQFTLIPPNDALTFWICNSLGQCPEVLRFAYFEEEIRELIKILATVVSERSLSYLPQKEVTTALELLKAKYPQFLINLTREPILIPILNFRVFGASQMSWPQHHCVALFAPNSGEEDYLLPIILHAFTQIIHYNLTGDLSILPLGFEHLMKKLSVDLTGTPLKDAESFAEIVTASLFYNTEYMPLAAYMELGQNDHAEIQQYLSWLQDMYSGVGDNIKKMMAEHQRALRA